MALASHSGTLAIYMGKAAASEVAAGLVAAGLPGDTPTVLVENASLPHMSRIGTRLDLLPLAARSSLSSGPALIMIGDALDIARTTAAVKHSQSAERRPACT
jgi:uroporphyrin-III C-methyltransferase